MSCNIARRVRCLGGAVVVLAVSFAGASGSAGQRGKSKLPEGTTVHRNLEYVKGGHESSWKRRLSGSNAQNPA